jgi:putative salt-induced outer membrane protein YdiY
MTDRRRPALFALCFMAIVASARAQDDLPFLLPPPSSQLELPPGASPLPAPSPAYGSIEELLPSLIEEGAAAPLDAIAAEALAAPPLWYMPAYWFGPDPWDAGVELGINGSEGNNSVFSMRSGGHVKRETKQWKFDSSLVYNKNHTNGVETQNNGKLDARLDRLLGESRYSLFVLENLIYDEFQAYNLQLSLNSGVGYQLIKNEATDLTTRVGAGSTREFGGGDENWEPQALFGFDFTHAFSKMQRLSAKVDHFPEWDDFRNYRVVSDVSYEVDLDQPKNLSLKFSLIDRYDSSPDGAKPNALDYAVLLLWKL